MADVEMEDSNSEDSGMFSVQGRQGNVTFRPYRDIKTKTLHVHHQDDAAEDGSDDTAVVATCVDNLYPELLCHIFSYLDTVSKGNTAQVCKRWRNILNTKEIWKGCEAKLHLRRLTSSVVVPSLKSRGIKRIQILNIRKSLKEISDCLPTLTSINMSGCSGISDGVLVKTFCQDLPLLTNLNLSLCKEVSDRSSELISSHCPNLENLQLGGCTGISNLSLKTISEGLKRIKCLNLRSCWQVSDVGVLHLSSSSPLPLEDLNLQDCQKVSDVALRHISQGLNIVSLNLSFCANISDSGMKSLARISSLKTLNLRSCDNISDIGVGYLAEGCVGLQTLDLSFCDRVTDRAMVHIASGLFNLRSLSLVSCKISDEGVAKMCKTLVDLHILNIGQCSNVTDTSLDHIGSRMKQLRQIDLYGCNEITENGLQRLKTGCSKLQQVNFNLWH